MCFVFVFLSVSCIGGGRGGRGQHIGGPLYELKLSHTGWYKITIAKAAKYEKSYLISLIGDYVKPYEFDFYCFNKIDGETYTFFVSNFDLAEKLYLSARGKFITLVNSRSNFTLHSKIVFFFFGLGINNKIGSFSNKCRNFDWFLVSHDYSLDVRQQTIEEKKIIIL